LGHHVVYGTLFNNPKPKPNPNSTLGVTVRLNAYNLLFRKLHSLLSLVLDAAEVKT